MISTILHHVIIKRYIWDIYDFLGKYSNFIDEWTAYMEYKPEFKYYNIGNWDIIINSGNIFVKIKLWNNTKTNCLDYVKYNIKYKNEYKESIDFLPHQGYKFLTELKNDIVKYINEK